MRPSRRLEIGASVVAVLVFLGVLWVGGVFTSENTTAAPLTFHTAIGSVDAYVAAREGGGWTLVSAVGMGPASAFSAPFKGSAALGGPVGCRSTQLLANGTVLTAISDGAGVNLGEESVWGFVLSNSSGYLLVFDLGGRVVPIASYYCPPVAYTPPPVGGVNPVLAIPADTIDSSTAEAAVWDLGESQFVQQHPGGSALVVISPGLPAALPTAHPLWQLEYQACRPSANGTEPSGLFPTFNATVDGITGVLRGEATGAQPCGSGGRLLGTSTPSIVGQLRFGTVTLSQGSAGGLFPPCLAGDYCYQIGIASASGGVSVGDLALQVRTASGSDYSVPAGAGATFIDIAGNVVAYGDVPAGPFDVGVWNAGVNYTLGSTPISTSMTLWIDLGTSDPAGQGLVLIAYGTGTFNGAISVNLP